MFSSLSQNKNDSSRSIIYKNDDESRIWYIGDPPGIDSPGEPFRQVRVEQFGAPGKMEYELFADEASWDPHSRTWTFLHAMRKPIPSSSPGTERGSPYSPETGIKRGKNLIPKLLGSSSPPMSG